MTTEQPYVTWWGLGVTKLGTEAHCAHAVAMTDGVCAQITVCGKPVEGPGGRHVVRLDGARDALWRLCPCTQQAHG